MSYFFDIMDSLQKKLRKFGLNDNEVAVYLSTLKAGDCSVGTIERATGLHRQLIYNAADSLVGQGLMEVRRSGGRRRFVSAEPSVFEEIALRHFQQAKMLSKSLQNVKKRAGFSGEARIFTGIKEIQRYYLSSVSHQPMRTRVDILGVESKRFFDLFPQKEAVYTRFERERVARRIRWRLLLSGSAGKEIKQNKDRAYLECRILQEKIAAPMDIIVWRDHVGLLMYTTEPTVFDIPGAVPAQGFRKYLSLLWSKGADMTELKSF